MRWHCLTFVLLFLGPGLGLDRGHAQPPPPPPSLVARLRQLVEAAGVGEQVGVTLVDVASGRPVFQYHSDRQLNPASNMKLVTAAAALRLLGTDFTMRTTVHGRIEGDRVVGGLAIRGSGDPTLGILAVVEHLAALRAIPKSRGDSSRRRE